MELGRIGIWTDRFDGWPIRDVTDAAARIEARGYGTLWVPETLGREAMAHAALLLAATSRIVVANGLASVYARDAVAMAAGQRTLAEAFPGRTLLGLGIGHPSLVEGVRGHRFGPPVATMRAYLDAMDATGPLPDRVLGALGPRMLAIAADRARGALPLGMPVEHTAVARRILGPDRLLAVVQVVVADEAAARAVVPELLPNRAALLDRLGLRADDIVVHGRDQVTERVEQHLAAGADHVALHPIGDGPWAELVG